MKLTKNNYYKVKTEEKIMSSQIMRLFIIENPKYADHSIHSVVFEHEGKTYICLNLSDKVFYESYQDDSVNFYFQVSKTKGRYKFTKVTQTKEMIDDCWNQDLLDTNTCYFEEEKEYGSLPEYHPLYDPKGKCNGDNI